MAKKLFLHWWINSYSFNQRNHPKIYYNEYVCTSQNVRYLIKCLLHVRCKKNCDIRSRKKELYNLWTSWLFPAFKSLWIGKIKVLVSGVRYMDKEAFSVINYVITKKIGMLKHFIDSCFEELLYIQAPYFSYIKLHSLQNINIINFLKAHIKEKYWKNTKF